MSAQDLRKKKGLVSLYSGLGNRIGLTTHASLLTNNDLTPIINDHELDQVLLYTNQGTSTKVSILNKDLSWAEQCGNGLRALAHMLDYPQHSFNVGSNKYQAWNNSGNTWVNMGLPRKVVTQSFLGSIEYSVVDMGNPHCILVNATENPEEFILEMVDANLFPQGINVGFVTTRSPGEITLKTFERGAGWTKSCASNACAASFLMCHGNPNAPTKWSVQCPGGTLQTDVTEKGVLQSGGVTFLGMTRI